MTTQFESILEIFKHPKVKLVNKAFKKQSQLFESENEIDVQFNGYNSIYEYQEYINKCFLNFKIAIEKQMAEEESQASLLIQKLDLLKFEFKTFRRRYFQHNNDELMLSRIEILKNSLPVKSNDPFVKKNTTIFFS